MKVVVLQSNYLPWKGYFDLANDADLFVFYDEVQYTKNDWRNRNRILTKNGPQWLTIPIDRSAVKLKISEVPLPADASWLARHHRSLAEGYRAAPFFFQLKPLIDEVFLEKKWARLSELNQFLTQKIAAMLGLSTRFEDSKNFDLSGDRVERLLNLLTQTGATEYISGPSGRAYLAPFESLFWERNIRLTYKNYGPYPEYRQLSSPFEHAVSIVDLLANVPLDEAPVLIWGDR